MNRPAHHLRNARSIVTADFVDPGRQGGVHVTGLCKDRREIIINQLRVESGRGEPGLEADPPRGKVKVEQRQGRFLQRDDD